MKRIRLSSFSLIVLISILVIPALAQEQPLSVTPVASFQRQNDVAINAQTIEPSATSPKITPTLPLPTNAPTATVTVAPIAELQYNGSFEEASYYDTPDYWSRKHVTSDKRKCNKPGKVIAYDGECFYQFKSSPGEESQIMQMIWDYGILPIEVNAGDVLVLKVYANASGMVDSKVLAKVGYGTSEITKLNIKVKAPTNGYQAFVSQPVTATGRVIGIRMFIKNMGTSGKVRFDALTLTLDNKVAP